MDRVNYSTCMYSGNTEYETYSSLTTSAVSGSYYEHIKEEAAIWLDKVIQRQGHRGHIVVADYGTADGVGFLSMMNSLLDKYLRRMKDIDIMIYLSDQPPNDFNLLIKGITGPATNNLKCGLGLVENISVAVIGRSMYERPCDITDGLTFKQANKEEKEAFQEQAKQDWHRFLVNRGKELKKGGWCVILCLTNNPEDDDETDLHVLLSDIWKRLVDSDMITKEEYINTTLEDYIRNEEEFSYPFATDSEEIITLGLRMLSSQRVIHRFTRMIKAYSTKDEEQTKNYADAVVSYIKPWLRNTIYYGLSTSRSEESRSKICDAYFQILWQMAFRKEIKCSYLSFQRIIMQKH